VPQQELDLLQVPAVLAAELGAGAVQVVGAEGDTSRKGNLCTLRAAGGISRGSEGSEATLGYPFIGVPGVIASEIDVLPAERGGVLE
jgi:hypothetical protein